MPRAPKVCAHPGCPNDQPCPHHKRKAWAGSTRRQRLPPDWERRRRRVLRRDPICRACGLAPSEEVDHVKAGDDHSMTNLQGLCIDCHRYKTKAESAAARRAPG